jgi:hypothetical protein
MVRKKSAVKCYKLGNVNNGLLTQSRHTAWQQNIAGRARERYVARDCGYDDSTDAALIESIRLNDEDWPRESRFRSAGLRQVRPPDLAALNV